MAEAEDPTGAVVAFTGVAAVFALAERFMGAGGSTAEAGFAGGLGGSGEGARLAATEGLAADRFAADLPSEALRAETEDSAPDAQVWGAVSGARAAGLAAVAREWDGTSGM